MGAGEIPGLGTAVLGSARLPGSGIALCRAGDRPQGAVWSHSWSCATLRQPGCGSQSRRPQTHSDSGTARNFTGAFAPVPGGCSPCTHPGSLCCGNKAEAGRWLACRGPVLMLN